MEWYLIECSCTALFLGIYFTDDERKTLLQQAKRKARCGLKAVGLTSQDVDKEWGMIWFIFVLTLLIENTAVQLCNEQQA